MPPKRPADAHGLNPDRTVTDPRGRLNGRVNEDEHWIVRVDARRTIEPVVLGRAKLTIGRRGHVVSPFELDDDLASREHARVERMASGGYELVDLDSKNGTFLNGERIRTQPLAEGDLIRIGDALFLYGCSNRLPSTDPKSALVGAHPTTAELREDLQRAATAESPVLILGESGVGKEVVAEELHNRSGRKGRFVPVNVAALPVELAEAELFGHVDGAFTGASGDKAGLFRSADDGTLFLDEIGEMSAQLQAKMLRVLSTGGVRPVSGEREIPVDFRLVAATNRDLELEVAEDRFRGDLFARLDGWRLSLHPLRERRLDVLVLAAHFLGDECSLTSDAAETLVLYPWPYNVRELQQVLVASRHRAKPRDRIDRGDLPERLREPRSADVAPGDASLAQLEVALVETNGNVVAAAEQLGQSRHQLNRRLEEAGIDPAAYRAPDVDALRAALRESGGNVSAVAKRFGRNRRQVYRWLKGHGLDPASFRES